ncbi:MAG: LysR family transcriptional regulator [Burkholderiales bacterium]|nr:LysR family transcriptional regulator [Burkholderiales bacterium]
MAPKRDSAEGSSVRPEVRFHIRGDTRGSDLAIGPGKVALLEAIRDMGSITSAAKALGMSYRRAWLLVDETNRCLVAPAVATASGGARGGGSALTTTGSELVRRYRALERETEAAVKRKLQPILRTS